MYPTNRIISAFANPVDWDVIEAYASIMKQNDLVTGHYGFPPILGFASKITEDDLDDKDLCFMTGEPVTEEHLHHEVWKVTDGHHRTNAAIKAGINFLDTEPDASCFTTEKELIKYRNSL